MIQNINFSSIVQNSDLNLNFNSTRQHKSRSMLSSQNRALDVKILIFYANRDNSAYFEKCNFQQKLICQF